MVPLTTMNNRSKLAILVILSFVITTVPTSDGYSSGVHNQASNGCSCHYSVAAITANHTFPTEYMPGQIYSIAINVNGGTQSFNGGFNVMVNKGIMTNPGSFETLTEQVQAPLIVAPITWDGVSIGRHLHLVVAM